MKNLLLLTALSLPYLAWAQPENDLCADAIDINELFAAEIGVGTSVGPYSNLEATGTGSRVG